MPQVIEVTDAKRRKAAYVPLSRDGMVVDSSAVVEKLENCEERLDAGQCLSPAERTEFPGVDEDQGSR